METLAEERARICKKVRRSGAVAIVSALTLARGLGAKTH